MLKLSAVVGFLVLAGCGSTSTGGSTPPPATGNDIDPAVSAPLANNLEQAAAQSGTQNAVAAQGATLALQAGVQSTTVNITAAPTPPPASAVRARSGALSTGAAQAYAFQLTLLNVPQGPSTQVFSGVLVFTDAADAALAAGPSPASPIPPGVGLILTGGTSLWSASAGQVSAQVGAELSASCPHSALLPSFVTGCTLNAFANAGFSITASSPASSVASGSKTASLAAGAMVGAALSVDCSKTTLCGTAPPPGSVAISLSAPSTTVQTGGNLQFTATVTGSSNTAVAWTASRGSITGTGLYTAPSSPGSDQVVAVSVADTTKSASVILTVTAATTGLAWVTVATGADNSLGVKADGSLWSWGGNYDGELGNGAALGTFQTSPVMLGSGYAFVATGSAFDFAITTGGALYAWGSNKYGQLGIGSTSSVSVPTSVGTGFQSAAAGYLHAAGIKTDGTMWAWGDNTYGEIGDGTTTAETSPVQVGTDTDWASVSAGYFYTMALKTDGTLWAWGWNTFGQTGDGTASGYQVTPVQVGTGYASISATWFTTYAVKTDGTFWGWGDNLSGGLGTAFIDPGYLVTPGQIGTGYVYGTGTTQASIGLALKTDGTVWGSGDNGNGVFGNGTTTSTTAFVQTLSGFASIRVGSLYVLGLKPDGTLWGWGDNTYGELGIGSTATVALSPVQVH